MSAAVVVTVDGFTLEVTKVETRMRERWGRSRLYVWPKGESVLENFENRRSRPVRAYRALLAAAKAAAPATLPSIDGAAWSQRAGCACGCSPGFVLREKDYVDYHVTVRVREAQ